MACFIVPAAEAVVTTVIQKVAEKRENNIENEAAVEISEVAPKFSFSRKVKWLSNLLWGGSGLLAMEHFVHGEVVPVFPFLSGFENPADMISEMSTIGVTMCLIVTAVWGGMCLVSKKFEKRATAQLEANK